MCKKNEMPKYCDIIFFTNGNGLYQDIHYWLLEAKEGTSLNMDLNLAYELALNNSNEIIPLLNKLVSKLVSLYPNSLALISKSFSHSSLYLTSKFINLLNYLKEKSPENYEAWIQDGESDFQLEQIMKKAMKFILDNVMSAQSLEEIFHLSKIALDSKENIRFVDWGLETKHMKINASNPKEQFQISIQNGLCEKLLLDDAKLIYNEQIFKLAKETNEYTVKFNLPTCGMYPFEITSKNYGLKEIKIINSYSSAIINSVQVSVFNEENEEELRSFNYSSKKNNYLNISLKSGEIATFVQEISFNNFGEFSPYSCFSYLLLHNQISDSDFIITKRQNDKLLILNLTDNSTSLINDGNYSTSIVIDCEFVYPKLSLFVGYLNVIRKEKGDYEYNNNEVIGKKDILTHTFHPPMKVPSIIFPFALSFIPFLLLFIFMNIITYLNLKNLIVKRNLFIFLKMLSFISMILIYSFLLIYWLKLDIFQGLFIFGISLGIVFPINYKLLQIIPFSFEGEFESFSTLNEDQRNQSQEIKGNSAKIIEDSKKEFEKENASTYIDKDKNSIFIKESEEKGKYDKYQETKYSKNNCIPSENDTKDTVKNQDRKSKPITELKKEENPNQEYINSEYSDKHHKVEEKK